MLCCAYGEHSSPSTLLRRRSGSFERLTHRPTVYRILCQVCFTSSWLFPMSISFDASLLSFSLSNLPREVRDQKWGWLPLCFLPSPCLERRAAVREDIVSEMQSLEASGIICHKGPAAFRLLAQLGDAVSIAERCGTVRPGLFRLSARVLIDSHFFQVLRLTAARIVSLPTLRFSRLALDSTAPSPNELPNRP